MNIINFNNTEYKKAKDHLKRSYLSAKNKGATMPERKNLQNLPDCIESIASGAFIASVIVESQPTKTSYIEGEIVELAGLKVTAIYTNGAKKDVTDLVKCTPADGDVIKLTDTQIKVEYKEENVELNEIVKLSVVKYVPILQYIEVNDPPKKTIYLDGNRLDLSGMVITATYGRGERVDVTSKCVVTPAAGTLLSLTENKINISYSENGITKTTQLAISVEASDRTLVEIEIQTQPTKLKYYTGESFDPTGMKVIASFVGGIQEDVTESCSFTPAVITSVEETTIEVSYSENELTMTDTLTIEVEESVIESIEIVKEPETNYFVGQVFDPEGLKVVANYNSGKQVDITDGCTFSNLEPLTSDDRVITIGYLDFTAELPITVVKVEMVSIEVTKAPNKLVYYEGDSLNLEGLELTANFNNGSTMVLTTGYSYSPTKLTQNDSAVTIVYQGLTTTFAVTVLQPVINKIEVTTPPAKTAYVTGQFIDTTGIIVTGTYTDGKTEDVTSQCTFSPTKGLTIEDTAIVVTYKGITTTIPITVTNFAPILMTIEQNPTKVTYLQGDSLDLTGLIVKIIYNDGTTTQLLNGEGVTATPTTNLQGTNTSVTVSYTYNGITLTQSFAITVVVADPVFANNSWETIQAVSDSGAASLLWNVGDTKSVAVGDKTYTFRIIGFDHDNLATPLANGRTKAGITLDMAGVTSTSYPIVDYNGRFYSKWTDTVMYQTTLPAIFETLEETLKPYIKEVSKVTYASGGLTTDTHKLFLPAVKELKETYDSSYPTTISGEGTTYEYYKSANSIWKGTSYWTRTYIKDLSSSGGTRGCAYTYTSSIAFNVNEARNSFKLSLAFCI